jgi:hypothetical protein
MAISRAKGLISHIRPSSASYVFYSSSAVVALYIRSASESGVELITRSLSISRFMILTPPNIDKIDIMQPLTHSVHFVQIKTSYAVHTEHVI